MHIESYNIMNLAIKQYLNSKSFLSIMDFGSYDVNGTYRNIFSINKTWQYTGVDMCPGKNVDVVVDSDFIWENIKDDFFDVVISGQVMEHVKEPWTMAKALGRVCKTKGIVFLIAPNTWGFHPYPIDCWRIFPDGMEHVMSKYGGFEKLECGMKGPDTYFFGIKK